MYWLLEAFALTPVAISNTFLTYSTVIVFCLSVLFGFILYSFPMRFCLRNASATISAEKSEKLGFLFCSQPCCSAVEFCFLQRGPNVWKFEAVQVARTGYFGENPSSVGWPCFSRPCSFHAFQPLSSSLSSVP